MMLFRCNSRANRSDNFFDLITTSSFSKKNISFSLSVVFFVGMRCANLLLMHFLVM